MAVPTLVQHTASSSNEQNSAITGNSFKFTLPNPVLSGNCLVLAVSFGRNPFVSTDVVTSITDSSGDTWSTTPTVNVTDAGTMRSNIFVLLNATAGVHTITIGLTAAQNLFQYTVSEFYNVATASAANGTAGQAIAAAGGPPPTVATGSFTPGNNDASGGNLIYAYFADDSTPFTTVPTTIAANGGFTLLDGSIGTNSAQMVHASMFIVQATAAAINPTLAVTAGGTDTYNCLAVALKAASAGTAPAATGIRITKIFHDTNSAPPTSWIVQFPSSGNLLVLYVNQDPNITGITDSKGNTWVRSVDTQQIWHADNATTALDLKVTLAFSAAPGNRTCMLYDIVNAATVPEDGHIQAVGGTCPTTSSPFNLTDTVIIAPASSNGLTIATILLGIGPVDGFASGVPAGATYDFVYYTGDIDADRMDSGDGCAHVYNTDTTTEHWNWHIPNVASASSGSIFQASAAHFKGTTSVVAATFAYKPVPKIPGVPWWPAILKPVPGYTFIPGATAAFQDIALRLRLAVAAVQDVGLRMRLSAAAVKDVALRFRLSVRAWKDVALRLNLGVQAYKDVALRARMSARAYQDTAVRARLAVQAWKDTALRMRLSAQAFKDAQLRSRLSVRAYKDTALRFALAIGTPALKDIALRFRLSVRAFTDIALRFRLSAQAWRDVALRFRLSAQSFKDIGLRARISALTYKDTALRFFLGVRGFKDIALRARLIARTYADIALRMRLAALAYKDVALRARLSAQALKDIALRLRLSARAFKDIALRFSLVVAGTAFKDVALRFRLSARSFTEAALRFRLSAQAFKDAQFRFRLSTRAFKDAPLRFGLGVRGFQDAALRARLSARTFKDIALRFSLVVQGQAFKDIALRARISARTFKDAQLRFGLGVRGFKDIALRFRLVVATLALKDVALRFRLSARTFKDIAARFGLGVRAFKDVSLRARVSAQTFKDVALRARISARSYRDVAIRFALIPWGLFVGSVGAADKALGMVGARDLALGVVGARDFALGTVGARDRVAP